MSDDNVLQLRFVKREDWMNEGACRGMDTNQFFTTRGEPTANIKALCHDCVVRAECLEFALRNGEHHGVWGGLSERERRRLRPRWNADNGILEVPLGTHGTVNTYVNRGCRCEECRAAIAAYRTARRHGGAA